MYLETGSRVRQAIISLWRIFSFLAERLSGCLIFIPEADYDCNGNKPVQACPIRVNSSSHSQAQRSNCPRQRQRSTQTKGPDSVRPEADILVVSKRQRAVGPNTG